MIDSKDFHTLAITVYTQNGNVISQYTGKAYLYYGDDSVHYIDENNKHHRFYNAVVGIDEIE